MSHPRDVWIDITTIGAREPRLLLAVDGYELDIAEAKEAYVRGRITIEELEQPIASALPTSDAIGRLTSANG
jgi:hypothetical protein